MRRRLSILYQRYLAIHGDALRRVSIGRRFTRLGRVEAIERVGAHIRLRGWVDAERLTLSWGAHMREVLPNRPRADVAAKRQLPLHCGFEIDLPGDARNIVLRAYRGATRLADQTLPHPNAPLRGRDALRAKLSFARQVVRALPQLARYARRPGPKTRRAVKVALGQDLRRTGHALQRQWLQTPAVQVIGPKDALNIIVPVYNALDLLQACVHRVAAHTDVPWRLIVVDDASTDPALRPWLTNWARPRAGQVTVLTSDDNAGFVASVNTAFAYLEQAGMTGPVVLLNTDAMVPAGWASRLIAPLVHSDIASVTPMSNNAEIFSVPAMGSDMALPSGTVDAVDAAARRLFTPDAWRDAPTGVGFCMAMSARWLAKLPRFDTAFGRGYGEEVDWCQKARNLGARHVVHPGVFVEHHGGQSFGNVEKLARMRAAGVELSRRYPRYDADVQRFIHQDPLATPRLALAVSMAAHLQAPLPVFVTHALGGGADLALMQEVSELQAAIVLRVGGSHRWQVEVHMAGRKVTGHCDDFETLSALLITAPQRHIIYSCGVGDPDPLALPGLLLALRRPGDRCSARLHDYFMLSPSYTLLGSDGQFRGVPAVQSTDPAHGVKRPYGAWASLADWRAAWGAFLGQVEEVVAFSDNSASLFAQAYPQVPMRVQPHHLAAWIRPVRPQPYAKAIGILGNVNHQKGAHILVRMAEAAPSTTFVVIGKTDSTIPMPRNVRVHGVYAQDDISELAERYGIATWVMPAIWPETFSFVTHEALATGLPVVGFALGAQGGALDRAANGLTVPLVPEQTAAQRLLSAAINCTQTSIFAAE